MEASVFEPMNIDEQSSSDDTYTDESLYDTDLFLEQLKGDLCLMQPEYLFKSVTNWTSLDFKLWIEHSFIPECCPEFTLKNTDEFFLENLLRNFNKTEFVQFDRDYGCIIYSQLKLFDENILRKPKSQDSS
jgi:hypothetical protein